MLKSGDTVTLSINPTISIAKYEFIKPLASITHELVGPNFDGELIDMQVELQRLLYKATLTELNTVSVIAEKLAEGGVEALAKFCVKEIGGGVKTTLEAKQVGGKLDGEEAAKNAGKKTVKKPGAATGAKSLKRWLKQPVKKLTG